VKGTEITKVGIVSCSGESIAEGTISRLATRRVLELLRPDKTVTICLPLFVAGNEGEQNFAKMHPTIAVDGCSKQCARFGTEQHSGPVSGALIVSEILGSNSAQCIRSSRGASKADQEAVWIVAEQIAAEVDRVLDQVKTTSAEKSSIGAECACSTPLRGGEISIGGATVTIPGLQMIFAQCLERGIPADDSGSAALFGAVKVYHRILPEEDAKYRAVLLIAYRDFCREHAQSEPEPAITIIQEVG
jgi:uncharacterized metal-binding protein